MSFLDYCFGSSHTSPQLWLMILHYLVETCWTFLWQGLHLVQSLVRILFGLKRYAVSLRSSAGFWCFHFEMKVWWRHAGWYLGNDMHTVAVGVAAGDSYCYDWETWWCEEDSLQWPLETCCALEASISVILDARRLLSSEMLAAATVEVDASHSTYLQSCFAKWELWDGCCVSKLDSNSKEKKW